MDRTMYMKDGRIVDVIAEDINGKVLVAPWIETYSCEGSDPDSYREVYDQVPSHQMIFVSKENLMEKAPIEVFDKQVKEKEALVKELDLEIREAKNKVQRLNNEIALLEKKKGDTAKFIFDMSPFRTVKRLAFFLPDSPYPVIIDPDVSRYDEESWPHLQIKISPATKNGIRKDVEIYYKTHRGWDNKVIDLDYGVLFDPTDEEIMTKSKERCDNLDLQSMPYYSIFSHKGEAIYPEYLSQKGLDYIVAAKAERHANEIVSLRNAVEEAQKKLDKAIGPQDNP